MVGYAWQKGLVPLGRAAIERAIDLNGVAVDFNKEVPKHSCGTRAQ